MQFVKNHKNTRDLLFNNHYLTDTAFLTHESIKYSMPSFLFRLASITGTRFYVFINKFYHRERTHAGFRYPSL